MHCQANTLPAPERQDWLRGAHARKWTADQSRAHPPETAAANVTEDENDRNLLRRISDGDADAFRQLYFDYYKRLARFLVRFTRRPEDLEEVINDTLLIVWQQAGDFRGASRVSTWILGIAYRRALRAIRKSTAWSRATALASQEDAATVEDTSKDTEERQLLDFGLSCLSPEQRLVLVLAYRMDCSCEEIAVIAGCPVNTVKSRLMYARRNLREILCAAAPSQNSVSS